jgi:hypothetical protein
VQCRWLTLAEQLQLDSIKELVLDGIKSNTIHRTFVTQLHNKELDGDLLQLGPATLVEVMRKACMISSRLCASCTRSISLRCDKCGRYQ